MGYAYFKALETPRLTCFPSSQLTTRLNFTLGQSQSFTEHLQHSITSSWPFVHLFLPPSPLLFFPLEQTEFSARAPAVPSPHSASGKRVFYNNLLPSITLYTDTDAPPRLVQRESEGEREKGLIITSEHAWHSPHIWSICYPWEIETDRKIISSSTIIIKLRLC